MPRPVDAVRAVKQAQDETKLAKPVDGRSSPSGLGPPESPPAIGGTGGTSPAPIAGTVTISFNATPEVLRALLLLLQGSTGDFGSLSNPSLNGFHAPEAPAPPAPSRLAPVGDSEAHEISRDAETLLVTLSRARREAERNGLLEHAWCSMAKWFRITGMDRHRKDAAYLIGQLLSSELIEFRKHGPKKGWDQYQATTAGMQRAESGGR